MSLPSISILLTLDLLTGIATPLSVIFSFYMTSIAIFSSSGYASRLHSISNENGDTLWNDLVSSFKYASYLCLFFLVLILLFMPVVVNFKDGYTATGANAILIYSMFYTLLIAISISSFILLKRAIAFVTQQGKQNNIK